MSAMAKTAGTMTEADLRAEITRRANALMQSGLTPEQAITAAGSSVRAERARLANKEISDVRRWLTEPSTRR